MAELFDTVSLKKKLELCNGLLLIAQSADFFKEDKKLLKGYASALKKQKKKCKNTLYPIAETDKSEVLLFISDLHEIVLSLSKVKGVSQFQVWHARLVNFVTNLTQKIDELQLLLNSAKDDTVAAQAVKKNEKN